MTQVRNFKKELNQYKNLSSQLNKHWSDKKKEEFFKKHINNGTMQITEDYIYYCDQLLTLLDEANHL